MMRVLLIIILLLAGCGVEVIDENVSSFKLFGHVDGNYQLIKTIDNKEEVTKIKGILNQADWSTNVEVNMAHPPDYRIGEFDVWITPKGKNLELITRSKGYYVYLNQKDSSTLYQLMTGKDLREK